MMRQHVFGTSRVHITYMMYDYVMMLISFDVILRVTSLAYCAMNFRAHPGRSRR